MVAWGGAEVSPWHLAVGEGVVQARPLLPRHPLHLLPGPRLHLRVAGEVEDAPEQGGGGGLSPSLEKYHRDLPPPHLEQVQAGELEALLVKVRVHSTLHFRQIFINEVPWLVGVSCFLVLLYAFPGEGVGEGSVGGCVTETLPGVCGQW